MEMSFIWLVRFIYIYLPMERMEDKEVIAIQYRKISELEEENKSLKEENDRLKNNAMEDMKEITKLEQENKKLREFKEKREESMFYFKSQMERAEPKTAREAEDLQKAKELFEKLYREELYYLEKENKQLKENIEMLSWNIILW